MVLSASPHNQDSSHFYLNPLSGHLLYTSLIRNNGACQAQILQRRFFAYTITSFSLREVKLLMAKSKKDKNKAKLNLTVRDEQRNKLEQMASLEKRFVRFIEVIR